MNILRDYFTSEDWELLYSFSPCLYGCTKVTQPTSSWWIFRSFATFPAADSAGLNHILSTGCHFAHVGGDLLDKFLQVKFLGEKICAFVILHFMVARFSFLRLHQSYQYVPQACRKEHLALYPPRKPHLGSGLCPCDSFSLESPAHLVCL